MKHLKPLLKTAIFNNPKLSERELAEILFPNCSANSARTKLKNRLDNKTETISEKEVSLICSYLNITPNKLFGYEAQD